MDNTIYWAGDKVLDKITQQVMTVFSEYADESTFLIGVRDQTGEVLWRTHKELSKEYMK